MTNSFSSVSSELHSLLYPIFSKINNENWDQCNGIVGSFLQKYKCCIGAHIAKELKIYSIDGTFTSKIFYSTDGCKYLCNRFKLSKFELNAIFHCAGSPKTPFGPQPWKNHPLVVLNNIRYIETCPPIEKNEMAINFFIRELLYYERNDVKEWLEIERKRIELCKEREKMLCTV